MRLFKLGHPITIDALQNVEKTPGPVNWIYT